MTKSYAYNFTSVAPNGQTLYYKITSDWLNKAGVKYHKLEIGYKQNADLYVDDKAITPDEFVKMKVLK